MSGLAMLTEAYERMAFSKRVAEDQLRDIQEYLALWFLESHEGAREFLIEIAREHRETSHPVAPRISTTEEGDVRPR